jgi:micrococcal nuclease
MQEETVDLYYYKAHVISVYDGDTCTVSVDLGFNFEFKGQKLRLDGIDAPELRGDTLEAGRASRDYLRDLILDKDIYLETIKDSKGKYGRYLAKIWIEVDGELLCANDMLVSSGHAIYREY